MNIGPRQRGTGVAAEAAIETDDHPAGGKMRENERARAGAGKKRTSDEDNVGVKRVASTEEER